MRVACAAFQDVKIKGYVVIRAHSQLADGSYRR